LNFYGGTKIESVSENGEYADIGERRIRREKRITERDASRFVCFTKYYYGDQIKDDAMGKER
jgi:hypothetical protein